MELRNDHLLLSNNENKIFFPIKKRWKTKVSVAAAAAVTSVVSDSVRPHKQQPTRLLCPWDSPGNNTGVGCHFLLQCMKVKSESEAAQLCPTLSDPMDCSPPGSSVHVIFQARVLEWGAIAFSPIPLGCPKSVKWKWKLLSRVQLFATPWTVQFMEFSRPEHWSG